MLREFVWMKESHSIHVYSICDTMACLLFSVTEHLFFKLYHNKTEDLLYSMRLGKNSVLLLKVWMMRMTIKCYSLYVIQI